MLSTASASPCRLLILYDALAIISRRFPELAPLRLFEGSKGIPPYFASSGEKSWDDVRIADWNYGLSSESLSEIVALEFGPYPFWIVRGLEDDDITCF